MKNRSPNKSMTHKTEYVPKYVLNQFGNVYEYIGSLSVNNAVVRSPGTSLCYVFDVNSLEFCPSLGQNVFYLSNGSWYAATVLDYFVCNGCDLAYKIRVYDSRWNNPIRVLTVAFDDLNFQ